MSALFPTATNIWRRVYRLMATDIRSIWQALEDSEESTEQGFYDGFIYHPPI